jgi:hypothetical protein
VTVLVWAMVLYLVLMTAVSRLSHPQPIFPSAYVALQTIRHLLFVLLKQVNAKMRLIPFPLGEFRSFTILRHTSGESAGSMVYPCRLKELIS